MPVLRSRSSLVSFRLTDEEHELVKAMCVRMGVPSLSQFARDTVLRRAQAGVSLSLGEDLATISQRLWEINSALRDLSGRIERASIILKHEARKMICADSERVR